MSYIRCSLQAKDGFAYNTAFLIPMRNTNNILWQCKVLQIVNLYLTPVLQ